MKNQYKTLALLLVITVVLSVGTLLLYQNKYVNEYTIRDPDSGQMVVYNSATTHTDTNFSLLGSQKLLDQGMSNRQYTAVLQTISKTLTETYQDQYKSAAVNTASVKYSSETDTYTFKVRVGEPGSSKYISVTATLADSNTLQMLIRDGDKTLKEATVHTS